MTDALRYNDGKPELHYLLTWPGWIEMVAPTRPDLHDLGRWYRGEDVPIQQVCHGIVNAVGPDAAINGVACVATYGAGKYAIGNYLHGHDWSSVVDSLLRHALAPILTGEEIDPESGQPHAYHVAWNAAQLLYCVTTMPERDDRVRAPDGYRPHEGSHFIGALTGGSP